jgi:CBS domain containing-hemolysin-like protein
MEDMVEEIVGEILEGGEEQPIEFTDDGAMVRGEVNIEDVNEALDVEIPEGEEFETLAGFIFNRAGRLVEEGEQISYDDLRITVEQVENTRIMKARLEQLEPGEMVADGEEPQAGVDVDETAESGSAENH